MNNEPSEDQLKRDPNMIEMFDKDGKRIFISKVEYRQKVLPASFIKVWHDPDQLYSHISFALKDGFYQEALDAAKQLKEIDPDIRRGYTTCGVVFMYNKKFDEARNLFIDYLNKYGNDAYMLTYLAKTFNLKTEKKTIQEFLEKAINLDPNQHDALQFWTAIINEDQGRGGFIRELTRLSQLPNTWRPQLWLAREYLIDKRKDEAMRLYDHILSIAKNEPGVLMKISGDLGSAGFTNDVIRLILPLYNPNEEDPYIGFNLLQSFLETESIEEGKIFLEKMYELNRPDIKERLDAFKSQFDNK